MKVIKAPHTPGYFHLTKYYPMESKATMRFVPSITLPRLSPAAGLTISYLVLSITWILVSDSMAARLAGNNGETFERIQELKGIFFVLLSGSLLFLVTRKLYTGLQQSTLKRESIENRFLVLNEAAREGFFDYDIRENRASLNNKMRFFFPAGAGDIENFWQTYQNRIHRDDIQRLVKEYTEILQTHKQTWLSEFRLMGNDGKYYNVISNTYILCNKNTGLPIRLIGAIQDISDLRTLKAEYYEQQLKHKRTLAASIIRAQESERDRWAGELHDNVCQILSVVNMYATSVSADPGNATVICPQIKKLVTECINEIRQLSACIKTPSFEQETLMESIQTLTANINRANHIEFTFNMAEFDESKLCPEQQLMIYRVVQEQINNILKYAEAGKIEIHLATTGQHEVKISVRDDGKGFDPEEVKTGIGLKNIQSRLQVYGGHMELQSAPGKGCNLLASFSIIHP